MELNQAKEVISQAIDVAIRKGCYTLTEAQAIIRALDKISQTHDIEFGDVTPIKK